MKFSLIFRLCGVKEFSQGRCYQTCHMKSKTKMGSQMGWFRNTVPLTVGRKGSSTNCRLAKLQVLTKLEVYGSGLRTGYSRKHLQQNGCPPPPPPPPPTWHATHSHGLDMLLPPRKMRALGIALNTERECVSVWTYDSGGGGVWWGMG